MPHRNSKPYVPLLKNSGENSTDTSQRCLKSSTNSTKLLPFIPKRIDRITPAVPPVDASLGDKLQWLATEHPYTLRRLHDLTEVVLAIYRPRDAQQALKLIPLAMAILSVG